MNIVHVVADLAESSGGPSRTVVGMAGRLASSPDFNVTIVTSGHGRQSVVVPDRIRLCEGRSGSQFAELLTGEPYRALKTVGKQAMPDVVVSHGLWLPANFWAGHFARRHRLPLIIQPHGMLSEWALRRSSKKKAVAKALFQWRDLRYASAIIASSDLEYSHIRKARFGAPIFVSPNGIDIPQGGDWASRYDAGRREVLFIGRIHPVKGLDRLLHAWSLVPTKEWTLRILGPDNVGYRAYLMRLAEELSISNVEFGDAVSGDEKARAFLRAEMFVLPSSTESFGVVVAEALSYGLPVITTDGTPWEILSSQECGWCVPIGIDPLRGALLEAMAISAEQRRRMGANARAYAARFSWQAVSHDIQQFFRWAGGEGGYPSNLRFD